MEADNLVPSSSWLSRLSSVITSMAFSGPHFVFRMLGVLSVKAYTCRVEIIRVQMLDILIVFDCISCRKPVVRYKYKYK